MVATQNESTVRLINNLGMWGWPHLLNRLAEDVLFIADQCFFTEYYRKRDQLTCKTATPDKDGVVEVDDGIRTVLVFLKRREYRLVRQLRRQHPDIAIYSAQYDLAPNSTSWPAKLPTATSEKPAQPDDIILLLSTPCSDAEFLGDLLAANSMGTSKSFFGRPLVNLLEYVEDFEFGRYLAGVARVNRGSDPLIVQLQTDVIQALLAETVVTPQRLSRLMKGLNCRVIHIYRQDKLSQSVLMDLVQKKHARSIWSMSPAKQRALAKNVNVPLQRVVRHLQDINTGEEQIVALAADLSQIVRIELDALVEQPEKTLRDLAKFLGQAMPEHVETPDYFAQYRALDGIADRLKPVMREIVDRLGLHVV